MQSNEKRDLGVPVLREHLQDLLFPMDVLSLLFS